MTDLRTSVLGAIEESSGGALRAGDPLPDSLIATAEILGVSTRDLLVWIHQTKLDHQWSSSHFAGWARRYGLTREHARCAFCSNPLDDGSEQICAGCRGGA